FLQQVHAQVTVSGASVGNGTYSALSAAFLAINSGSQTGTTILISITSDITEITTARLLPSSGAWTKLTISPSGNRIISGNLDTLIDLKGADYVTIDGLNDGTNSLIIDNTKNTANVGTIELWKDASYNTIKNCTVKGSSVSGNDQGVIFFGTANSGGLGNDYNTITNCIIRESSNGYPIFGISSKGTSGLQSKWNSNNTVTNNQIINTVNLNGTFTAYGSGIQLTNAANTDWTISGNSFYFTSPVTSTAANNNYGIRITGGNGFNFLISGNYFGGTAQYCGGTPMTFANDDRGNKYCGIDVNVASSGTATSIQGNTISNIVLNTNSNANTLPGVCAGIAVEGGLVLIGTVTGNIVGSNTVNGSLTVNTAATSTTVQGAAYGITILSPSTFTISNNQVSGITLFPTLNSNAISFYGIYINNGSGTISSNTVGSTTLSNSIQNSTGLNFTSSPVMAGIFQTNTGLNLTISSNTVCNLISSTNNAGWQVSGIVTQTAMNTITGNTVMNLTNAAKNYNSGFTSSVVGIGMANSGGTAQTISSNIIHGLQNTNTGTQAYAVVGMALGNSGSGHVISQNLIYDLKNSSTGTTAPIDGIRISQGTMTISNNMISLGSGLTNNPYINAINIQGGKPAVNYNSVVVTGAASGSAFTNCIRMELGLTGTVFQNNIFYNDRTSATPANNQAMYFTSTTQRDYVTTCNYNDLYVGASATVLVTVTGGTGSPYANLTLWQANSGGRDLNSISSTALFINIASDLHLTDDCLLSGRATVISITVDYDNQTRGYFPDIGADEINTATWTGVTSSDWNTASNWSPALVPTSISEVIIPGGTPYSCTIFSADATCHTISIFSTASFSMITNKILTINANCTYGGFANYGTFSAGSGLEEVAFNGLGTVLGTVTFNVVSTNNGLTFSTITTTVNKKFRIDAGGYVAANPPIYTSGIATLQYNTTGIYGRSLEWSSTTGAGYPNHVQVSNNTTLDLGNGGTNILRKCGGDLNIDIGSTLSMDYGTNQMTDDLTVLGDININGTLTQSSLATWPYNDINITGNWTRASGGVFNPNCRSVFFNSSSSNQTITVSGGGTEIFNYVGIDKTGKKLILEVNTDMKISATSSCGLGNDYLTITNGDIDLTGRTLYFEGPAGLGAGTLVMNMNVQNGTRSILSSVAGGVVNISSTLDSKTLLILNGGGSGKILFDNDVEVRDASGEVDFGAGNLGTINYILRINSGGAVVGNAPYYTVGSTLIFSTGTVYDMVATQQSWETGTLGTTPGVPWNVEVNLPLTDVRASDNFDRCVRNNMSILAGTFELGAPGFLLGNLTVGGNWARNNSGTAFVPNLNKVTFNSTVNAAIQLQTITMNGGGNETFYDLEENNSLGLTLSGTTNAYITSRLYLISGLLNTSSNEVYVTNNISTAITFDLSNGSADSWINGFLRRAVATGSYGFPVGTSTLAGAAGYELMNVDFTSNTNVNNLRMSFSTDGSPQNEPYNVQVNGSIINNRLDAGWWSVQPYDAGLSLIASPVCNYNVSLYERGHNNSQFSPLQYAVIKRDASYCYDVCATSWTQCGFHLNTTQWESGGTAYAERSAYTCNSFSDWAIGFADVILPIEITAFDVITNGIDAVLTWNTSAEYNSDYFAVERSTDGIIFNEIGRVIAAGFSAAPLNYSFTDPDISKLQAEIIYYRLRMADLDNSVAYSQVKMIELSNILIDMVSTIYPNPFNDQISFQLFATEAGSGTFTILNELGQTVLNMSIWLDAGVNPLTIDRLNALPSGIYYFMVNFKGNRIFNKAAHL
ncbi:MAG: hypothetical protein ABIQ74_09015, partial [Chitinophagales bacterium]